MSEIARHDTLIVKPVPEQRKMIVYLAIVMVLLMQMEYAISEKAESTTIILQIYVSYVITVVFHVIHLTDVWNVLISRNIWMNSGNECSIHVMMANSGHKSDAGIDL